MNYLAHAFLSKNDEHLLIGNFIADHLRGNDFSAYPQEVVEGILLHRRIDSFTDQHEVFRRSKRIFYDGFEKYSGILVDIYFDHLLAKNFHHFSDINLKNFSGRVYKVYKAHRFMLPTGSDRFLNYVLKNNIYEAYAQTEGIEKVLYHLSHRIGHGVQLDVSIVKFLEHESSLSNDFRLFFEEALDVFKRPSR